MPLWQIYHPPGTFEDHASKQAFVDDITKIYTNIGLPAFYVNIQFQKVENKDLFIGGKIKTATDKPFVRLVICHIAVNLPNADAAYLRTTSRLDKAMKPHLLDNGYDFEYHVDETERRLWKINSMIPPPWKSAEERVWFEENMASPYEGAYPPNADEISA